MVDVSITAANVVPTTTTEKRTVTCGAAITAGLAVYEDSADGFKVKAADCTTSAATAKVAGLALGGGNDDGPLLIATGGELDLGFTATEGVIYVLSEAGAIAPVADLATGDYVTVIGVGNSSGNVDLIVKSTGSQVQA